MTDTVGKPLVDRRQQLLVFFSVDICGGTDYKARHPVRPHGRAWIESFREFFEHFDAKFQERVRSFRERAKARAKGVPRLWKLNGDEMLYCDLVDSGDSPLAMIEAVRAFVETVQEADKRWLPVGLGAKGCVWTAGFPIRNRKVIFSSHTGPVVLRRRHLDFGDFDTGDLELPRSQETTDYLGVDMDLGFRIAHSAIPGRVVGSLDVAWFLSQDPYSKPVNVYHVGWRRLKGVGGGDPYPLFLLTTERPPRTRVPWETSDESIPGDVREVLSGKKEPIGLAIRGLADSMWESLRNYFIQPYRLPGDMSMAHWATHVAGAVEAPDQLQVGDPPEITIAPEVTIVEQDLLNQIQLELVGDPSRVKSLRAALLAITETTEYQRWSSDEQFSGTPFKLPRHLAISPGPDRRILEEMDLVRDDYLRVKLTRSGDLVFLTDGVWVPGAFRVFPFEDETDLLLAHFESRSWQGWRPTHVIDPACGCGHGFMKVRGAAVTYGFDINGRALSFARTNACLNPSANATTLALSDIEDGIPSLLRASSGDRVLFIVNMPFALQPDAHTLPVSAAGGPMGYEKTLAALRAIKGFRDRSPSADVRALVLTYTLGTKAGAWVVSDEARKLFGVDAEWTLLGHERLWRVNGKKEQPNPMPVERLRLKADCRFYVHGDETKRAEVREGYDELASTLKGKGLTQLAYGIVTIAAPSVLGSPVGDEAAAAAPHPVTS